MRPLAMNIPEPGRGSSIPIDLFTAFALTSQRGLGTSMERCKEDSKVSVTKGGDKEVMEVLSKVVDHGGEC
ncbi:hypothetical protein Tco_0813697 [Tanacetum coccineum]